jgi:hypothetical protein
MSLLTVLQRPFQLLVARPAKAPSRTSAKREFRDRSTSRASGSAGQSHHQRHDEENQEHPEQKLGRIDCDACDTTEAKCRGDECDDKEDDGVMKKIAHDDLLSGAQFPRDCNVNAASL